MEESVEEPATAVVETESLVAPVEEIVEEAVEEPEPLAPSITEEEQEEIVRSIKESREEIIEDRMEEIFSE